jgi:hypothetical protein
VRNDGEIIKKKGRRKKNMNYHINTRERKRENPFQPSLPIKDFQPEFQLTCKIAGHGKIHWQT